MNNVYQLVLLGEKSHYNELIIEQLFKQIEHLGLCSTAIQIINNSNFHTLYRANNPTYCLYFGSENKTIDNDLLNILIDDATLILPVISNINNATNLIPESLKAINVFELKNNIGINKLVNCILEGFGLLRTSRKLFISYKRSESSTAAIQLYEALEKAGFDVFLDTHSIKPGEPFQEELWHRMTDCDVVILLSTPKFLESQWTREEFAKANAMSLGVIQIIWPGCTPIKESDLFQKIYLKDDPRENNGHLSDEVISQIISETESIRARTLAARQDNLTTEFIKISHDLDVQSILHADKFITFTIQDMNYVIVPTVGIPQSFTSNNIYELRRNTQKNHVEKIYLLYDHVYIREKWLQHLIWLDEYLPVKTLKLLEAPNFLAKEKTKNDK